MRLGGMSESVPPEQAGSAAALSAFFVASRRGRRFRSGSAGPGKAAAWPAYVRRPSRRSAPLPVLPAARMLRIRTPIQSKPPVTVSCSSPGVLLPIHGKVAAPLCHGQHILISCASVCR